MNNLIVQESKYPLGQLIQLSDQEYFDAPGLNQSGIKDLMQSAKHFYARNIEGKRKESTPAQKFGSLVHLAILQPDVLLKHGVFEPKFDKRTTIGKEHFKQWEENLAPDAIRIDIADKDPLHKMIQSWLTNPLAKVLSESCLFEHALFWIDAETKILCKAKFDLITIKPIEHNGITIPPGLCGDLKTTTDARATQFIKSIFNYKYDIQAAWYLEAIQNSNLGAGEAYLWLALENDSPYEIECHTMESMYFANAREINRLMRLRYKECLEKNEWPGYKKNVKSLHFNSWQWDERAGEVEYISNEMGIK